MKTTNVLILLLTISLFVPSMTLADMFEPAHNCSKPYKPYKFNNQYEVDNFNDDVRRYKECINNFIEEQNDSIKNHSNAIDNAIDDWNRFVNFELS